jgi:hypothetical protein
MSRSKKSEELERIRTEIRIEYYREISDLARGIRALKGPKQETDKVIKQLVERMNMFFNAAWFHDSVFLTRRELKLVPRLTIH